jgi:hypothetical protein
MGNDLEFEDKESKKDDEAKILDLYSKRTFSKHGWEFILVSKKNQMPLGVT